MADRDAQVAAVAALAEPTRRRLYEHVVRQPHPVSRDEAAAARWACRVATAAFHLDRLVADGLLDVHYERRTGRTGPGAGRPAKLYRRAECAVAVSLPERHYDLAGDLLAAAMARRPSRGAARGRRWPGWPSSAARNSARARAPVTATAVLACSRSTASSRGPGRRRHAGQLPVPRAGAGAHRAGLRHEPAAARGGARRRPLGGLVRVAASRRRDGAASGWTRPARPLTPELDRVSTANHHWL